MSVKLEGGGAVILRKSNESNTETKAAERKPQDFSNKLPLIRLSNPQRLLMGGKKGGVWKAKILSDHFNMVEQCTFLYSRPESKGRYLFVYFHCCQLKD